MQSVRSARTPAAPHRCCPPQHVPLRRRSVYGLVSGTFLPGRLPTPKRSGIVTRLLLTYRCGGSAGLALVGFTGFPFHSRDHEVYEHLNARRVCRSSSAASTASQSAAMPPAIPLLGRPALKPAVRQSERDAQRARRVPDRLMKRYLAAIPAPALTVEQEGT